MIEVAQRCVVQGSALVCGHEAGHSLGQIEQSICTPVVNCAI
jgi:hypothetical protein